MSAAKLADAIQSLELRRTSLKRAWLKIDFCGLTVRSIEVHHAKFAETVFFVETQSLIVNGRKYLPFNFHPGEFKEFLLRLVTSLWNETQDAAENDQLPYVVKWSAETQG